MKPKSLFFMFCSILLLIPSALFSETNQMTIDTVWTTALNAYAKGELFKPQGLTMLIEELEANGRINKTTKIITTLSYANPQKPTTSLISAFENGKDITEEYRKKNTNTNSNQNAAMPFEDISPLLMKVQNDLKLETDRYSLIPESTYLTVPYLIKTKKTEAKGTVIFFNGTPNYSKYAYKSLPLGVNKIEVFTAYHTLLDGEIVIKEIRFDFDASILFVRKIGRFTMFFEDWKKID